MLNESWPTSFDQFIEGIRMLIRVEIRMDREQHPISVTVRLVPPVYQDGAPPPLYHKSDEDVVYEWEQVELGRVSQN